MKSWHLNGVVLPGTDRVDLWVRDGVISAEPIPGAESLGSGLWIMPGLVDAHCHIGLGAGGAVDRATAEQQAITDRNSGVLLIRDAGAPVDTHWVDARADLPRVIRAGRHIARPKRYLRNYAVEIDPATMVAEVERQARAGDGWVKLVGDWIDREAGDLEPLWPAGLAEQAISRAHELGAKVTAHCFAEQSVSELVAAGIDCIEHGTGMSDEVIAQMAHRGVSLVPTMTNLEHFPDFAAAGEAKFPTYSAHMRALHASRYEVLGNALDAGVPVYAGTDSGGVLRHGRIAEEAELLARLGGAEFALGAISWRAREWLGAPSLTPGAPADLVIYRQDPRVHLDTLHHPAVVMLRGALYPR
ncbi:amidohydrolase family protein [Propionimicrobium sp. PCR01-08-3]|uniref:amidohydrolase family protein n=1 Tax=Propionimicrobium sp. PCR01-08-3 TaxID=3052086 RepID=UPI00255D00B5|nr:amidohydrolase family protein [Propionimicrobium sp. PCR01-08-3]WIY81538.1 amidohydrolase family protein [Propionimicrobium sp. PCR01-08-3]